MRSRNNKVIEQAIADFLSNQDIMETAPRKCIAGYIVQRTVVNRKKIGRSVGYG